MKSHLSSIIDQMQGQFDTKLSSVKEKHKATLSEIHGKVKQLEVEKTAAEDELERFKKEFEGVRVEKEGIEVEKERVEGRCKCEV